MNEKSESVELSQVEGQYLVELARQTIREKLGEKPDQEQSIALKKALEAPVFFQKRGTFVTLHKNGRLRGCIGTLDDSETIKQGIEKNALNAAFYDPRFPELKKDELGKTHIEISILSKPLPLKYKGLSELLSKLEPGVHGVIIQKGSSRATFLPQVWDQLPEPESFLSHLCTKAGLPSKAWEKGNLKVITYTVQYFQDS